MCRTHHDPSKFVSKVCEKSCMIYVCMCFYLVFMYYFHNNVHKHWAGEMFQDKSLLGQKWYWVSLRHTAGERNTTNVMNKKCSLASCGQELLLHLFSFLTIFNKGFCCIYCSIINKLFIWLPDNFAKKYYFSSWIYINTALMYPRKKSQTLI